MSEKLTIAVEAYVQAKEAYSTAISTDDLEALKNVFNEAAHRIAFLVWLNTPVNEAMPIIPGIDEALPFPSFDISDDTIMSDIDAAEAEHPESIPDYSWLDPLPDTEEDAKERTILADEKKTDDAAWYEAATEEELAGQSSNSGDLFDDDDYDADDDPYYRLD